MRNEQLNHEYKINFLYSVKKKKKNWAGRNLLTNLQVYSLLIMQAKLQTKNNNN